jgi:uncharacterized membrane protein YcjF (UPF0283 family)
MDKSKSIPPKPKNTKNNKDANQKSQSDIDTAAYFDSWISSSKPFQSKLLFEPTNIKKDIKEIDEEKRAKQIDNDAKQQDIELKKKTLNRLFILLCAETVVIFIFAYWQGRENNNFNLDGWSFRLITSATILQITTMLIYAVRHLFPNNKEN